MKQNNRNRLVIPPEQEAIRAKCFHPTGTFIEFKKEEVEQSIAQRFETIARMCPDKPAVEMNNRALSYGELNASANRLARTVIARQGYSARPVALLFDKGSELPAAMLGVLKAGKFFILLDLSFPKARLASMMEDAEAELVVADRENISLTRDLAGNRSRVIEFESIDDAVPDEDLCVDVSPRALAFISYTSGSTGHSKGVVQNHRNVINDAMQYTNVYHFCQQDRLSLLSSGTSTAVKITFYALLNGLTLFPFDVRKEGVARLARWLAQERISICWISSPLFRNFAATLTGKDQFPELRLIRLASDTVRKSDIGLYKKYFPPGCILAIGLSSSETGFLRSFLVDHGTEIQGNEVPVGYSVNGKEVLLLDDSGKEIGSNEIGEIVVKSQFLSTGYWRRPELTSAKFIADPQDGEKRLYLTGDLGLMLDDGCLIHKGRKDFRVKIRGYGVETAEVEKALRDSGSISETVVLARENKQGDTALVAYFTSRKQPGPTVSELRKFLQNKLPDYMIPSAFVHLHAIPLTSNGKVDRRALPHPGNCRPDLNRTDAAPRTPVESQLVRMWAEVLSLDQVGIHDNFFDLGGHSLAATRLVSQLIKTFQLDLPLQVLFQAPTVAQMAAVVTEHQGRLLRDDELARILTELEALTDEEAQRKLSDQTTAGRRGHENQ